MSRGQQQLFSLQARPNVLRALQTGARNYKTVTIRYVKQSGEVNVRETEPYEIKDGKYWGYCLESDGIRQFNLERIMEAQVNKLSYVPRWPVKII